MFLGVLITGGYGTAGGYYKTAQIYVPQSKQFCSLPDLNNAKALHTQDGFLNCGGWQTSNLQRCWNLAPGTNPSISQGKECIMYSQSWTPQSGVGTYLIGGSTNGKTTDLVKTDGTVMQGFNLKYDTRYLLIIRSRPPEASKLKYRIKGLFEPFPWLKALIKVLKRLCC